MSLANQGIPSILPSVQVCVKMKIKSNRMLNLISKLLSKLIDLKTKNNATYGLSGGKLIVTAPLINSPHFQ